MPEVIEPMPEVIEVPIELTQFQLPAAVQARSHWLLERQDNGHELTQLERQEAEGLVEHLCEGWHQPY